MTLKLSLSIDIGVSFLALIAVLIAESTVKEQSRFAHTRGTPYDDLLSSVITENSSRNELPVMSEAGLSVNSSIVFIYGDLGNDQIRGSNKSDHLGGRARE